MYDYTSADVRVGYIGNAKVNYVPQNDGWILIDGDKLIRTKGELPSEPLPRGLQHGVGVRAGDRWPGGVVPYTMAGGLSATMQNRIAEAINHWNTNLAGVIQLVPRTTQSDYAQFTPVSSGCSSPVGYFPGEGIHPINLSAACDAGNVAHEIGHIVGLDHEQNRLDRDSYVSINLSKVSSGMEVNFQIDNSFQNYNFYDFASLMHYSLYAFSVDGSMTIIPKVTVPAGVTVGQRQGLTIGDINSVRLMYGHAAIDTGGGGGGGGGTPGSSTGLNARYYDGVDFKTLKVQRVDQNLNFDWGSGAPVSGLGVDLFSIRWTGYITPTVSGNHKFIIQGMDDMRVVVNNTTVFDMTGGNNVKEAVSMPLAMVAGTRYSFQADYRAPLTNVNSYFRLYWEKPDGSQELVPASAFSPDNVGDVRSACSAAWTN